MDKKSYASYLSDEDIKEFYYDHPLFIMYQGVKIYVPYKIRIGDKFYNFQNETKQYMMSCSDYHCGIRFVEEESSERTDADWQQLIHSVLPEELKEEYLSNCTKYWFKRMDRQAQREQKKLNLAEQTDQM